jgi:hypothetical protein
MAHVAGLGSDFTGESNLARLILGLLFRNSLFGRLLLMLEGSVMCFLFRLPHTHVVVVEAHLVAEDSDNFLLKLQIQLLKHPQLLDL